MSQSQNRKRSKPISVPLTPEEHEEILTKAAAEGLSAGGFLRACGLKRETPGTRRSIPIDNKKLEQAIAELRRVGNNLNQIARSINMGDAPALSYLNDILHEHTETLKLLREARQK